MIGTIRKHSKALWFIVIAATIISFVIFLSPSSSMNGGGGSARGSGIDLGTVYGERITPEQMQVARNQAKLLYRMRYNEWPAGGERGGEVERVAYQFILITAELKHNNIDVTAPAAARYTKRMFGLTNDEALTKDQMEQALAQVFRGSTDFSVEDFDRYVRLQTGQQFLTSLYGMGGKLIAPQEAESFYRRENEPMQAELALFPAANYMSSVSVSPAELSDFYNRQQAQYRVPEKMVVNYVAFRDTNFVADADKELGTNIDQRVEETVQQNRDKLVDETGAPLAPEAAKQKVKEQYRKQAELNAAHKAAVEFGRQLAEGHDDQHPFTREDLAKLAAEKKLKLQTSTPFDVANGSPELNLGGKETRVLFSLHENDPEDKENSYLYSVSPLFSEKNGAFYIVGYKERLPSRIPPLNEIKEQVTEDFKRSHALELAKEAGQKLETALQMGSLQGKTFEQICEAQRIKPLMLSPFALMTPSSPEITNRTDFQQIQNNVYTLPTGRFSQFVPTADGGFVAHVKARLPVDETKLKQELPTYINRLREQRQSAAFQEWLNHEAQQHLVVPRERLSAQG